MANKFKTYASMSKGYRRHKNKKTARKRQIIEKFEVGILEKVEEIKIGRRQIHALRTHV